MLLCFDHIGMVLDPNLDPHPGWRGPPAPDPSLTRGRLSLAVSFICGGRQRAARQRWCDRCQFRRNAQTDLTKPFSQPGEAGRKQEPGRNGPDQTTGCGHVGFHPQLDLPGISQELPLRYAKGCRRLSDAWDTLHPFGSIAVPGGAFLQHIDQQTENGSGPKRERRGV